MVIHGVDSASQIGKQLMEYYIIGVKVACYRITYLILKKYFNTNHVVDLLVIVN